MRRLAPILCLMLLLAPAAQAAEQAAPTQAPQVQPAAPPSQIPLSPEGPGVEEKKATKAEKDQLYALLVIGCALLPIAVFGFWKLWNASPDSAKRGYKPYRYSTGPADKRRVSRRNKR